MDTDKVGRFIASRRKVCGLTQQELAEELGITNKAVSKWETGQGMPDITALPLLADILGVTVDELLSGESLEKHNENAENTTEVNKVIYWFKAAAGLSVFFAVVGVIVPFFMMREASVIGSLLFGFWWTVCSAAVFFTFYIRMKNVIQEYNRRTILKMNPKTIRNQFLRFELWVWLLVPSRLIAHSALLLLSVTNTAIESVIALAITVIAGIMILLELIGKKTESK
jgi:transcriptional regulator with XRE-family HTH domain